MTEPNLETRVFSSAELRMTKGEDGVPRFEGYAARFNKWSEDLGGFREKIAPKAFSKALKTSDTRALFNHDSNYVLGRTTSKTLDLREDDKGLKFSVIPPDTQWARDLGVSMERGDITQCSFGFTLSEGGDEWHKKDGAMTRTIREVRSLADVSIVTFPAYPDTSVALRSLDAIKTEAESRNESIAAMVSEIEETMITYMSEVLDEEQQTRFITMCKAMVDKNIPGEPMQAEGKLEDEVEERTGEEPESVIEPMQETADISLEDQRKFFVETEGD